eukprot:gene1065-21459_t
MTQGVLLVLVLSVLLLVGRVQPADDVPEASARLVELHHEGALTDEEFTRAKLASIATAESDARAGHAGAHDAIAHHYATDHGHKPVAPSAHEAIIDTAAAPKDLSTMYGFYLHVYADPAAVIWQVEQLKKYFP